MLCKIYQQKVALEVKKRLEERFPNLHFFLEPANDSFAIGCVEGENMGLREQASTILKDTEIPIRTIRYRQLRAK